MVEVQATKYSRLQQTSVCAHLWTWLSWRGKSKLLNEHPLGHCVKQWAIIRRFPSFPLQCGLTACRACAVAVPLQIARFPDLGLESQSKQFFHATLMTTHINQLIKLFKKYSPLIDRCRKLREGKNRKKLPWLGTRTPDLENREFEMELAHYAKLQHTLDT